MRHATIQNEACHYSKTHIEACHYSNTPNEACPLFKIVPNEALFQETVGFEATRCSVSFKGGRR